MRNDSLYTNFPLITHRLLLITPLLFCFLIMLPPIISSLSPYPSIFLSDYIVPFLTPSPLIPVFFFFFLNDTAPPEIYPFPLHDALPICFSVGGQKNSTNTASKAKHPPESRDFARLIS